MLYAQSCTGQCSPLFERNSGQSQKLIFDGWFSPKWRRDSSRWSGRRHRRLSEILDPITLVPNNHRIPRIDYRYVERTFIFTFKEKLCLIFRNLTDSGRISLGLACSLRCGLVSIPSRIFSVLPCRFSFWSGRWARNSG